VSRDLSKKLQIHDNLNDAAGWRTNEVISANCVSRFSPSKKLRAFSIKRLYVFYFKEWLCYGKTFRAEVSVVDLLVFHSFNASSNLVTSLFLINKALVTIGQSGDLIVPLFNRKISCDNEHIFAP